MTELPQLISDLALILIVAGLTTIIFKRLKQPLVLGYILAGFLAGPNMTLTPSVEEHESIEVWSQIGVIFLMFSLGLEFSFKKILKGGASPIIAACFIMTLMCYLMGWSPINCMFVGGMLAMSSTTIIYKAFDDMGLMTRRFASKVMSVLILEDILGIVVMVILSAVAVSNQFEGSELILSLLKLGFFLLLWFLVGMWVVPTFLHRNRMFINKETLVIVSIGLCFLMVVVADSVGYSTALGAFMMGSILAETVEAERIDSAISSIKDLFGAIFFVSVGMMVSPSDLVDHWVPIVVLVGTILVGQAVFGTIGYLLSGSSRSDALMSGFSMAQIGEFAFIIAALGESLGVTDGFLMPVVVATSIITTFLTPYMIKLAAKISGTKKETGERAQREVKREKKEVAPLAGFIRKVILQTVIYSVLFAAVRVVARHVPPPVRPLGGQCRVRRPGPAAAGPPVAPHRDEEQHVGRGAPGAQPVCLGQQVHPFHHPHPLPVCRQCGVLRHRLPVALSVVLAHTAGRRHRAAHHSQPMDPAGEHEDGVCLYGEPDAARECQRTGLRPPVARQRPAHYPPVAARGQHLGRKDPGPVAHRRPQRGARGSHRARPSSHKCAGRKQYALPPRRAGGGGRRPEHRAVQPAHEHRGA